MFQLNVVLEEHKSLEERLIEQAIESNKLTLEQYQAIVEAFNMENVDIENFWNYVRGKKVEMDNWIISGLIKQVLNVEQFKELVKLDIDWVR